VAPLPANTGPVGVVVLREYRPDDLEALEEYWTPAVRRWLSGTSGASGTGDRRNVADALERILATAGDVPRLRLDLIAEVEGRFVGTGRVMVRDEHNANGDIGYALREDAWGRGYGTQVACALIDLGFTRLGLHRVWATVHPENAASIRVLEKAGMVYEGRLRDDRRMPEGWHDSLLYAVLHDG
jgi:[ribosomal protein S5]-alanine N-acetyltransferase